jgi:hypothetical protein
MRLRVYGIPKFALALFGLLPGLAAFCFHTETFLYRRADAIGLAVASVLLATLFLFFFLSGFFRIRYLISILLFSQILFALFSAVVERNFVRLGLGVLFFLISSLVSI